MYLVIKIFKKINLIKNKIFLIYSYVVFFFFYMYILYVMNIYILDDLRRVLVFFLSWYWNIRMESVGNNIKRLNDDVVLFVINMLRLRFLWVIKVL